MAKSFYETIIASGGLAGEHYDVAIGPVLDGVLEVSALSAGDGSLGIDCPISVISTGALGAARELDISACEQDGRIILLSVRNSDITTNNLTLQATGSINGTGPTTGFVISAEKNYWLIHESLGEWRAYEQRLSVGAAATVFRATFASTKWNEGATNNQIVVVRTGASGLGEIGPHNLMNADSYVVQVYRDSDDELVDVGLIVDSTTGDITMTKTGLGQNFAGRIIVVGD